MFKDSYLNTYFEQYEELKVLRILKAWQIFKVCIGLESYIAILKFLESLDPKHIQILKSQLESLEILNS